ncbi:conserved exported hypothetical protein [Magnetospirillum sp. LM-5]|uniref:hypothetical protein n=1 Tax=Magnetospirillum sp. LM-5 TaxID=2681466 RepID=UPI001380071A|nr:hypothetical protein [Magnetospirillum sp. LM-5]CAA7619962.1 conserved exported hypothetical protein [Magnetospirillum sp. LM-5]
MIRKLVLLAITVFLAQPALAQVKVKRCLSEAEIKTEQLVRHGIFLRESGNRCDEYNPGTAKMWKDFDANVGTRFAQQTAKRKKLFEREFKTKALEVMTYFDGRLVTYYRHYPLGIAYCGNIEKLLKDVTKKGWNAFVVQAETIQNEVRSDYKVCK